MRLSDFIRHRMERILQDWEKHAFEIQPESGFMSKEELRDHVKEILRDIADGIDRGRSKKFRDERSRGMHPILGKELRSAVEHGITRHGFGFNINDVLSEYRALRTSVIQLWAESEQEGPNWDEILLFNEELDGVIKEAVEAFSAAAEKQRHLPERVITASRDHCYLLDGEGRFIYANASLLKDLCISNSELMGKSYRDLQTSDAERLHQEIRKVLNSKEARSGEVTYSSPSGEERMYEYIYEPIFGDQNTIEGLVALERDITDRKQMEERIRESEETFRAVQENSIDRFTILEPFYDDRGELIDFTFIYQNAEAAKLTGRSPEKLIGLRVSDIYPTFARTRFFQTYKQVIEAGQAVNFEDHYSADGVNDWFRVMVTPIPKGIAIATQIITERKLAEEAIRESQANLQSFYDSAPYMMGIAELDADIIVPVSGNRATAEFLGLSLAELPRYKAKGVPVPDAVEDLWRENYRRSQRQGAPVQFEYEHPVTFGTVWLKAVVSYIGTLSSGRPRFSFVVEDITERKAADEALQRRTEELAAANRDLEAFSYSVSHDLRSPLRVISGLSSLLLKNAGQFDRRTNDSLEKIESGANKMNHLINDILRLSRIGRQKIVMAEVDLSRIAKAFVAELACQQQQREIEVCIADDLQATGDVQLVKIAVTNLLRNAWKFTGKTDAARIEFGRSRRDGRDVFYISDNGVGFAMEHADRLFQPFSRLHSESEFPGTGIGLPIVYRVIRRHGGEIWAEGEVGKGATFYFTLGP